MERAFSLLGHILTHDCLNMSHETLHQLAVIYINKMDQKKNGNVRRSSRNTPAYELILLC